MDGRGLEGLMDERLRIGWMKGRGYDR